MSYVTKNIKLSMSESWYYDNGYLTIDLELFGKYLSAVFNRFLGGYYYFQKFTPIIMTDKERPIWKQGKEIKSLAVISPNLYGKEFEKNYNRVRVVHMSSQQPWSLQAYTLGSKEYPSLFSKLPLELDEKDYLLYFGDYACKDVTIVLGSVKNSEFVPLSRFEVIGSSGIKYSNPQYSFIEGFIKAIFNYRILNQKPNLDQDDMESILDNFGINKIEKLQIIVRLLKAIQEESTEILLGNNNVGNVLQLKKDNKIIK